MRRDLADQRDVFSFYLAVTTCYIVGEDGRTTSFPGSLSYLSREQGRVGENPGNEVDKRRPQTTRATKTSFTASTMVGSVIKTFADERLYRRLLVSNLGISFPQRALWGSCQGKLFCSRDISKPQTITFPRSKLPREKSVTLKKSSFPK